MTNQLNYKGIKHYVAILVNYYKFINYHKKKYQKMLKAHKP